MPRFIHLKLVLSVALLLSFSGLFAQSFTAEAEGFNVFVEEDFTFGGGDVEGAVAVGNVLTIQQNQGQFAIQSAGTFTIPTIANPLGLVVGNTVAINGGGVNLLSGGKISIGNSTEIQAISLENGNPANTRVVRSTGSYSTTPNISLNTHQSEPVFRTSPIDFGFVFNGFRVRSANVAALSNNVSITNANGNPLDPTSISNNSQIYIQSLAAGANILNLTGANLNKINSITFNAQPSASRYLIINVDKPGTFNWSNFNFAGVGSTQAQYILLNFHNATRVNINNSATVFGSVFAPNALVNKNNSANIDGQVIAKSFSMTQGGEVHKMYFLADDPSGTPAFPVEWLDFTAETFQSKVALDWATATEINTSHFVVERGSSLRDFQALGQVEAQGQADTPTLYAFEDQNIHELTGTNVYYRLKQVDLNGEFTYSSTLEVKLNSLPSLSLQMYPNPVQHELNLAWDGNAGFGRITIVNMQGQQILEQKLEAGQSYQAIPVEGWNKGMYFLLLQGQAGMISEGFLVR